jgi:hypothetical protein
LTRRKRTRDGSPKDLGDSRSAQPAGARESGRPEWLLVGLSTLYVLALLLAGAHPRSFLWGLDLLGYLPSGQRLGLIALLAASLALILIATRKPGNGRSEFPTPRTWLIVFLGPLAALFWVLRDRVHLLGDGLTWIEMVKAGSRPLYSEPLAATAMYGATSLNPTDPTTALAALSVACGLVVAVLYYLIAREITPSGASPGIAVGLFLALGCNQLYFGYIESYPVASVAILLYLWVMLRCVVGRSPLILAALALAVAISSHFVAAVLIPSFVFLVIRAKGSWARSGLLLTLPAVVTAGALAVIHYPLPAILEPIRFVAGGGGPAVGSTVGWLTKVIQRIPHLLNLCFLVAPIPLLIVLARLPRVRPERGKEDAGAMALLTAAVPGLLAAAALSLFVFPGHDWDLITMVLLPGIVFGVKTGAESLARVPRHVTAGLIGLGAVSLFAFVLVNASESGAVRRYDALLATDIPLSAHERAYGNERLVKIYTSRKDPELALVYAKRAVDADPANDRYWANVGSELYNLKRYPEATRYYEEAARRGSKRSEVYYYLAQSLIHQDRWQEALPVARTAVDLGGERLNYLFTLGLARAGSGDLAGARRVWDHVLQLWPEDGRTQQAYEYYLGKPVGPDGRAQ